MHTIKTKISFSGVPVGTTGEAEKDGELWKIKWHLPDRPKPLIDWFSQKDFDRYLLILSNNNSIN